MRSRVEPATARPSVLHESDPTAVARAAAALKAGQVVAIPTDTVYGLAAAIDQPAAVERLYALKGRAPDKPIPVLLSDAAYVRHVSPGLTPLAERLAARFWPGALTLVVPALPGLHPAITSPEPGGLQTVAIRIPDLPLARAIIAAAGGALAVTSANRSGDEPAMNAEAIFGLGAATPDMIVDGGPAPLGRPSTVVLATAAKPVVLREGAIPARDLREALASVARPRHPRRRTAGRRV